MSGCKKMVQAIQGGSYDGVLGALYAPQGSVDELEKARMRCAEVVRTFERHFPGAEDVLLFSAPGRTELGGNHTDHQRGRVLCAAVDLDMLACAAPNGSDWVRICSDGYPEVEISLQDLHPREAEKGTSAALVRGVAAGVAERGFALRGFDACVVSDVPSGSGLSSSAAYEVLIGCMFDRLSCGGALSPVDIAQIAQRAENVYFGKPCGLMDQMGSAVGGAVAIDFARVGAPLVQRVEYDFSACGHALCIVDTGSCHADLTDDYAAIPREMGAVAAYFGKDVLREVSEDAFYGALPHVRLQAGDRAVLRAMHYFSDDRIAAEEAHALAEGDFSRFLELVKDSGRSSVLRLQNIISSSGSKEQAVALALAVGEGCLNGSGAIRVHGGGFAGTIQAFVPWEKLAEFCEQMDALFGSGACRVLRIRPRGGCCLTE